MDTREVIGNCRDHDGRAVTLTRTAHDTPPVRGSNVTETFAAEVDGSSIGFLSADDLARWLCSWETEEYDSLGFQGEPIKSARTGLSLAAATISWKPGQGPKTGLYGADAEKADEDARNAKDGAEGNVDALVTNAGNPASSGV